MNLPYLLCSFTFKGGLHRGTFLSLSLSLCLLVLASALPVKAQGSTLCTANNANRTWELSLEVRPADVFVDIRVVEAATGDTVSTRTKVTAGTDVQEDCDWIVHFDSTMISNPARVHLPANTLYTVEFAYVDYSISAERDTLRYNIYQCSSGGAGFDPDEFHCPNGGQNIDRSPDTFLIFENGEIRVVPWQLASEIQDVGDYFPDERWMFPHQLDVVCASASCGANDVLGNFRTFISPQAEVPVGPSSYPPAYALSEDLTVPAGVSWLFKASEVEALSFASGAGLVVEGTLDVEGVPFAEANPGQGWNGIAVAGGTLDLDGATVRDAAVGVTVYQPGTATISGSDLVDNDVGLDVLSDKGTVVNAGSRINDNGSGLADHAGVRTGVPDDVTGTYACGYPCRSVLTLLDSEVSSNDGPGILALDADVLIDDSFIRSNASSGLTVANAVISPITETCIEYNGGGANAHGVSVLAAGDFYMSRLQQIGENRIAYSERDELHIQSGGYAFIGDASAFTGENALFDSNTTDRLVFNGNGSKDDVQAIDTYWGAGGPYSTAFFPVGSVDVFPYATTDPTETVCNVLPRSSQPRPVAGLDARRERSSSRFDTASGAGPSEAGRGGIEALRRAIRATRSAIAEHPEADSASGLVGRLYGLHKLDRDDTLGERAATRGLLTVLRAHLNNPTTSAGLRATAEAAVTAGVLSALTRGKRGRAAQLLTTWGHRVEGEARRRVLTAAEAHLRAAAGDYASAAALMEAVAEGEVDEAVQNQVLAVAAVYAGRAGEAARGGTPADGTGGIAVASRSGDTGRGVIQEAPALAVYPNPSTGAATVSVELREESRVRVAVYDVLGREVAVLNDGPLGAGRHDLRLDGRVLPGGVYLVRVESGERRLSERITLLR